MDRRAQIVGDHFLPARREAAGILCGFQGFPTQPGGNKTGEMRAEVRLVLPLYKKAASLP